MLQLWFLLWYSDHFGIVQSFEELMYWRVSPDCGENVYPLDYSQDGPIHSESGCGFIRPTGATVSCFKNLHTAIFSFPVFKILLFVVYNRHFFNPII